MNKQTNKQQRQGKAIMLNDEHATGDQQEFVPGEGYLVIIFQLSSQ